ncbi:MAG: type II secretion system F family protein [Nitrososphaerales archaeon]|nr:type II secretion system F family protein [Nitrososphaerales archaeon]
MKETERVILLVSRLMPVGPPPRVAAFFEPKLAGAMLLVTPNIFARFVIALICLGAAGELVAAANATGPLLFSALGGFSLLQACPFLLVAYRSQARRRSVEGELPFVAILLYILSHQSFANLPDAFKKLGQLGPKVFPAFYNEAQELGRNLAYSSGTELGTVERTFRLHPSRHLRELIHGYETTLLTGRDVHAFVGEEADRLLAVQEDRWRAFSGELSSMTEVSFIFLSIFPVGIQMVAGALSGGRNSALLGISSLALSLVAGALLLWMDGSQPISRDSPYPGLNLTALLSAGGAVLLLCYLGFFSSLDAAGILLGFSVLYFVRSEAFFRRLRAGEEEVAGMLHDLSELTRAGVELPPALSHLLEDSDRIPSLRETLSTFARLLSLGQTPVAAQRTITHPSWLVRVSFALLAVSYETGGGFEQLDRLSSSFRRVSDSRRSVRSSVLPFAALGVVVPALSAASFWFLRSMQALSPGFQLFSLGGNLAGAAVSILTCTLLTGLLVSKAYSLSVKSAVGLPPLLASALISLAVFGSP